MSLFGREAQIKGDTGDRRVPWGVSRGGLGARRGGFLALRDRPRVRLVAGGVAAYALLLVGFRYLAAGIAAAPLVSAPLILGVLGAVVLAFHATHFAAPDTTLGMWGRGLDRRPQPAPCGP